MSKKIYNWGIIGPGKIAGKFADDLQKLSHARVHAVASRSLDRAQAFADRYQAPHAYGSYREIVNCPDLDVVYIATPHTGHQEHTLLCLEHQIPVLCEKPLAINSRQVLEMTAAARKNNTFFMEALWTRFLPTYLQLRQTIEEGRIGKVLSVKADFGFRADYNPESRLFNRALGGGALLDIGIYPIFLALDLLGRPSGITAQAHIGTTGVDEEIGILFQYPEGQMAHLHASIRTNTKTEAFIYGERGNVYLHTRWHEADKMTILIDEERPEFIHLERDTRGYSYEAQEVMRCLDEGLTESPLLPLQFSEDLMATMDAIREQVGLVYAEDE